MPPIDDGDDVNLVEDVVVDIPDETVDVKGAGAARTEPGTDKPRKRDDDAEPQARISKLARSKDDDGESAEEKRRRETIERERDEATRLAAESRARADALEARNREETEARVKAEDLARLREDQAMDAHWKHIHSSKAQLSAARDATMARAEAAERDLIEATEKGDSAKAAAAQRELSKVEAIILQLDNGISEADRQIEQTKRSFADHEAKREQLLDQQKKQQQEREDRERQQRETRTPTADEWIDGTAKAAMGTEGADWLRENKQFVTDPKLNRKFLRFADEYADDHGKDALKSSEFLEALNEKFLADKETEVEERRTRRDRKEEEVERPRSRVPAAPVSRGDQFFSSRNMNAAKVKLPSDLASFVRSAGLDPTEYALGVVADIRAGKLPKQYLDPDYDRGL